MTKIIINTLNGKFFALYSNKEIEYVIVDESNIPVGQPAVSQKHIPDIVKSPLYTIYDSDDAVDEEIRKDLKRIHF